MAPATRTRERTSGCALITGFLSARAMLRFAWRLRHTFASLDGTHHDVRTRRACLYYADQCFGGPLGMECVARFAGLPTGGFVEVHSGGATAESRSENSD